MPQNVWQQKIYFLRCLHLNIGLPLEQFQLISRLSEYFWGRQWKHRDNIIESIFSDVTQFYIYEHLNTFSKYLIIIQYAYKYAANLLFKNK